MHENTWCAPVDVKTSASQQREVKKACGLGPLPGRRQEVASDSQ